VNFRFVLISFPPSHQINNLEVRKNEGGLLPGHALGLPDS